MVFAKAMSHIHQAMQELHNEMTHFHKQAAQKVKVVKTQHHKAPKGTSKETQPASDALLHKALQGLTVVHHQVQTLDKKGPHHQKVLHNLTAASKDLHVALKIK